MSLSAGSWSVDVKVELGMFGSVEVNVFESVDVKVKLGMFGEVERDQESSKLQLLDLKSTV